MFPEPLPVQRKVLVVEDEPSISDTILYSLRSEGFLAEGVSTGQEAFAALETLEADLVVLDVGLPDISGYEVCRVIRRTRNVPILFLTARSSEVDRVVGLEIGGDDYLVKPFSPRELTARIRAILRRSATPPKAEEPSPVSEAAPRGFSVDEERHRMLYFGTALPLSRYEFRLLAVLIGKPGRVYTRGQLMDMAWEEPDASMERTVDSHIKSIRSKLRAVRPDLDPIVTHRGIGYSLSE